MGTFTRGDIVVFPFPYTDLSSRKLRPCLVLSEEMGDDILLCQITSQSIRKDAHTVELKRTDTIKGTLKVDSYIRANMIFTAHKKQVHKRLCMVKDSQYKAVVNVINSIIAK
jgi:mRNA interferase MazF